MAWTAISGIPPQFSTDDNDLAVDYWLKLYDSGTTTPYSMATDSTGGTRLAKCKVSSEGYFLTNPLDDTTVFIPHVDQDYRIVLYRNETDADNNTTANAAFNVDGIVQEVAQLAAIEDITTKGTTLQAQDDYDRSPLFVDGTDFTAGAGPHVITVPADWNPTNADMRFYRLDNSGIVTDLTPTATTSTTFTLAETLLSTDTIYIGDDVFRNQMDGDPADIKARLNLSDALLASNNLSDLDNAATSRTNLDVYSEAEVDTGFQAAVADTTGYTQTTTRHLKNTIASLNTISSGSWPKTMGPTGSGADLIWAELDDVPLAATSVIMVVGVSADYSGVGQAQIAIEGIFGGVTAASAYSEVTGTTLTRLRSVSVCDVPVDSSNVFEVDLLSYFGSPALSMQRQLLGFNR